MRKLGKGQSVIFCVPLEVQRKILELKASQTGTGSRRNEAAAKIDVLDVLHWCIGETLIDLQKSMPLWAVQGKRFDRQETYWKKSTTEGGITMTIEQAHQFLEDEAETLQHRYHPRTQGSTENGSLHMKNSKRMRAIQDRCSEVGASQVDEAALQEEQERELAPEVEEERQVEKPAPAKPETHFVHPDLKIFVSSGRLSTESAAVMPAFKALQDTSAARHINLDMFPKDILVTRDFSRTARKSSVHRHVSDAYQRPVQWILSSQPVNWKRVVIISPYEANQLLPEIRKSKHVTLHLYCARPHQGIRPLDRLDLYSTPWQPPAWSAPFPLRLMVQLNLFAGQLYLKSSAEYAELCKMLRLSREEASEEVRLDPDGFIRSASSAAASGIIRASTFTRSPVKFLEVFLSKARRDCQSIEKTHLGKILGGALLQDKDFDEEADDDDGGDGMDTSEQNNS